MDKEKEQAVMEKMKARSHSLMKKISEEVGELVFQVSNSYIEDHAESDLVSNYRSAVRDELVKDANLYIKEPRHFWGKTMRATIYAEHKAEILPLINKDKIEELEAEVKRLKEWNESLSDSLRRY